MSLALWFASAVHPCLQQRELQNGVQAYYFIILLSTSFLFAAVLMGDHNILWQRPSTQVVAWPAATDFATDKQLCLGGAIMLSTMWCGVVQSGTEWWLEAFEHTFLLFHSGVAFKSYVQTAGSNMQYAGFSAFHSRPWFTAVQTQTAR